MNPTDQIAAEAADGLRRLAMDEEDWRDINRVIKSAIERAYEAGWHIGVADKLESRAAQAGEQ